MKRTRRTSWRKRTRRRRRKRKRRRRKRKALMPYLPPDRLMDSGEGSKCVGVGQVRQRVVDGHEK